ncbi:MAG: adenosylcobinamide amidohydrolase, partial [Deltaproteobacteria bacterium]|nr:adenosylcobinamide amidohydrolase [Deltaproteobacteria bacterium]
EAIKETLVRQNGLSPENRCDMSVHLQRFGGFLPQLKDDIASYLNTHDAELLRNNMLCLNHDPLVVAAVMAMVHVRDQLAWGVLPMSCLRDIFVSYGIQIAMAVSGKGESKNLWRESLAGLCGSLDDTSFLKTICCALALGFADKWRYFNNESEPTCPKKD